MNKNPLITVITPCFNSSKTIQKTLESVLHQTYANIEYIIIDGASTDGTIRIIDEYQSKFKNGLKLISEKDNGIYDAMNKGIFMASGDLIGIVNSDDYYELDAIENIVAHMSDAKYQVIYGLLRAMEKGKEMMVYSKNHTNLNNAMITHPTCFISKQLYKDFGLYNLKYKYSADYEFMLRISKMEVVEFIEIYNIVSNFSVDGASSSVKAYRDTLRLKKEYGLLDSPTYYFKMFKSGISMMMGR